MRTDPAAFDAANRSQVKEPRFVVKIEYPVDSLYITSHSDTTGIGGTVIYGALQEPNIVSQRLNPIDGRSEIGSAAFAVVDLGASITDEIRERLNDDEGLRDRQVRFYMGYAGFAFADFVLIGTQKVVEASFDKGRYSIRCADIQRSAKKEIFELAETTLAQSISATDTTIPVTSTTGFSTVYHGASYSDAANATVGYIKIRDEIIRYTGKTNVAFTGCTRGVLGTIASKYDVDAAVAASRREKVTEHIYLELPAVKLAYAILTGTLFGDNATFPSTWHLGINPNLIRLSDFTGIGVDIWNGADDGVALRFEGLKKTDGKKFLEEEICRLVGLFMPVYSDGALGLKRSARVLMDAASVATLDESNSTQVGELVHDMDELHNVFRISWNWNGKEYTRTTTLIDATSASVHGRADPLELKFKGLYGGKATDSLIFTLIDAVRDRYAAPPQRLSVSVLHSLNRLEIGDVVRVNYATVRDFSGSGASIDRSFEIQNMSVNHRTGQVQLELFGSTAPASALSPTTAQTVLPDAFYTAIGTPLSSVATITNGVMAAGTYTLNGTTDITAAASIWYHNDDLTIPQGCTINITGNVQLRVKGYLTINGAINGIGGGLPGVADDNSPTTDTLGNPGFVGNSRGWDGIDAQKDYREGNARLITRPVPVTKGKHASFPYLELKLSGITLSGIPTDLRGTGGGPGGSITSGDKRDLRASGGTGAAGGAGLYTVSRGFSTGASATVNLSGNSSVMPPMHGPLPNKYFPGAGGAGGPGAFLLLLDGSSVSPPDLTNRFIANTGTVPIAQPYLGYLTFLDNEGAHRYDDNEDPWAGFPDPAVISNRSLAGSALRIQYVPADEAAVADQEQKPPSLAAMTINAEDGFNLISWTPPADPASFDAIELFASSTNNRADSVKVFDGNASDFKHVYSGSQTRYYWIRTRKGRIRSDFYPNTNTSSFSAAARPPTLTGYLTNDSFVVPADSVGTVTSFNGAFGFFRVYVGTTEVTNQCSFTLTASSNLTATINPTTGGYSASAMSASVGTATFVATYAGSFTVEKVFSVTKSQAGADGPAGDSLSLQLTRGSIGVQAFADGTVVNFDDADGRAQFYANASDISSSSAVSFSSSGVNVTGTVNTAANVPVSGQPKGYYRITAMSANTGTLTINATYNGQTYTANFSISKSRIGFEIVSTLPSTNLFQGRMVFLTTDSKLYRYTGSAWTTAVPALDISGEIQNAQIAGIAAGKITGQLSDSQIEAVAATKVSGQLTNAQIADIAAAKVTGQLANSQIADVAAVKVTGQLADSQVAAISAAKVTGQITGTQITDGAVSTAKLSAGSVTTATLSADAVTADKIAANSITSAKIQSGAITTAKLAAGAVTANELAANSVSAGSLQANSVTAGAISAGSVTTAKIAAGAITANELAANSVTAGAISAGSITTAKIAAGAVTASEIAADSISAAKIQAGAIETAKLAAGAITADKIAASSITGDRIAANTINAGNIASNAITADKISAGSITAAKLDTGTLITQSAQIGNGVIQSANIGSLNVEKLSGDVTKFVTGYTSGGAITTIEMPFLTVQLPASAHPSGHKPFVQVNVQDIAYAVTLVYVYLYSAPVGTSASASPSTISLGNPLSQQIWYEYDPDLGFPYQVGWNLVFTGQIDVQSSDTVTGNNGESGSAASVFFNGSATTVLVYSEDALASTYTRTRAGLANGQVGTYSLLTSTFFDANDMIGVTLFAPESTTTLGRSYQVRLRAQINNRAALARCDVLAMGIR